LNKFFKAFKDTLFSAEGLGAVAAIVVALAVLYLFNAGPDRLAIEAKAAQSRFLPNAA
jgi:hypothetical protein